MTRELIGQELGKYRLIRLLGQGGFAEVYLGQHIFLKTEAAIKILHTRMTREQVLGFLQEAQVIARLIHPNIVRVLDFDVANNGLPFLVMDYCPHGTLRQRHANAGPLPLETVLSYVEQVAPALHYAHENKLIHRDIKPENMLIGPQNQILLSDFGIAASAHSTSSMSAQIPIGTIYYMAPEQIQAQARPASDQYALGVAVYEWLCGERPFIGSYTEIFAKHLMTAPTPLRAKVPALPPLVEEVVHKALAKDPHERFATVQAFAMALRQAAQSSGVASLSSNTATPSATLPPQFVPGGQAPAATVTPNVFTPPANMGIPPTQLSGVGLARAGEAHTDLPPLPAYPGQQVKPASSQLAAKPIAPALPATQPVRSRGILLKFILPIALVLICAMGFGGSQIVQNINNANATATPATSRYQALMRQKPVIDDPLTSKQVGIGKIGQGMDENASCVYGSSSFMITDMVSSGMISSGDLINRCAFGTHDTGDNAYQVTMVIPVGNCGGLSFFNGPVLMICNGGTDTSTSYGYDITPIAVVNQGSNDESTLTLVSSKGTIIEYVNGQYESTAAGQANGDNGLVSLCAYVTETANVRFKNLKVWQDLPA